MARVLLVNPPSPHRAVLRDYACGDSTKADYYWAPIDLLVLSGRLTAHHDVAVLDASALRLVPALALERAVASRPDVVFALTSDITLATDQAFLSALKEQTGAAIFGLGDVATYTPVEALVRAPAFDGFVHSFAEPCIEALADGHRAGLTGVVLRDTAPSPPARSREPFRYPMPRHDLFPWAHYRLPFSARAGSTSVLSGFGCPYRCTFCASAALAWRPRPIDDLLAELERVRALGIPDVYLRDFTFGPTRARAEQVARAIEQAAPGLPWSAECRVDVLTPKLLERMRRGGCDVILVGLESGSDAVSERLGKPLDPAHARSVLTAARRLGVRVCAHFVLGTPGERRSDLIATLRLATSLPIDYVSVNLYSPRAGSALATGAGAGPSAGGQIAGRDVSRVVSSYADVGAAELAWWYRAAVLGFYLRPAQLARVVSVTPATTLLRQGLGALRLLFELHRED